MDPPARYQEKLAQPAGAVNFARTTPGRRINGTFVCPAKYVAGFLLYPL